MKRPKDYWMRLRKGSDKVITLKSVDKSYKVYDENLEVLKDINLTIQQNKLTSIIGPSGSGKSTLLQLIGGLESVTKGEIWFNEEPIHEYNEKKLVEFRRNYIGFVFQQFQLLPSFTALENVMLPVMKFVNNKELRERAIFLLERVGLKDRKDHYPSMLSGGEQQRIAIARALINSPKLILADEPTGNLDEKTTSKMMNLIQELIHVEDVTIVLVTHNMDIARKSDHIYNLRDSTIHEVSKIEELFTHIL